MLTKVKDIAQHYRLIFLEIAALILNVHYSADDLNYFHEKIHQLFESLHKLI